MQLLHISLIKKQNFSVSIIYSFLSTLSSDKRLKYITFGFVLFFFFFFLLEKVDNAKKAKLLA